MYSFTQCLKKGSVARAEHEAGKRVKSVCAASVPLLVPFCSFIYITRGKFWHLRVVKEASTEAIILSSNQVNCKRYFQLCMRVPAIHSRSVSSKCALQGPPAPGGVGPFMRCLPVCTVVGCQWRALEATAEGVGSGSSPRGGFLYSGLLLCGPSEAGVCGTPRVPCPAVCPEPTAQPDDCFAAVSLACSAPVPEAAPWPAP